MSVDESHAHLHTDLLFGLPGQDLKSFGQSFNELIRLNPHEIQLGILKRLRGSPIVRHTEDFKLVFNPNAPYNILSTDRVDFTTMQQVSRFSRYWDMIGNSGRFSHSLPLLLADHPFECFWSFSEKLYARSEQTHKIALKRLFDYVYDIAVNDRGISKITMQQALKKDFDASKMKGVPEYLRELVPNADTLPKSRRATRNKRQARH